MKKSTGVIVILTTIILTTITPNPGRAQETQDDAALAKQAQNPLASLISLPVQNNTNFGIGEFDRTSNVLNIQPVVPFGISSNWNLITRTIIPVITQPDVLETSGSTTGLGDALFTGWFSPKEEARRASP